MSFQVVGLEFDRKDIQMNKLVATCLEGTFHTFDMRTQHPEKGFAYVTEKVVIKPDHSFCSKSHTYGRDFPVLKLLNSHMFRQKRKKSNQIIFW